LREIGGRDRVDVGGYHKDGLDVVAVEAVGIGSVGHAVAVAATVVSSSPSSRVEPSLILEMLPPGSCTKLLKSLESNVQLRLQLLSSLLPVLSSSLCAILSSMLPLGLMWLLWGACACGFVIESASSFPMLETLPSSCAWRLFDMASVSSSGLGDAVAIDGGGGGGSS